MDEIVREHMILVDRNVRIRQVRTKEIVVVLDARTEEQRAVAIQPQTKSRQITRALVIQALLTQPDRGDIACVVEDRERIAVLENRRPLRRLRRCEDVELILDLYD